MLILGIETSCDDTGLGLYCGLSNKLIDHVVYTQEIHKQHGGVVPELASRDHIRKISPLLQNLLNKTNTNLSDLDAIAYTTGPGLAGALLIGATYAKSLSLSLKIPSVAVNHIEGHLLAPMLEEKKPKFPYLALLVSGGHTAIVQVNNIADYKILGETLDDAAGEAFDKTAKLLGLGYPGGKILAKKALQGRAGTFKFPRPLIHRKDFDFSFSGLKTHVLNTVNKLKYQNTNTDSENEISEQTINDICYEFEQAVTDTLIAKCKQALIKTGLKYLVVAGGVGANLVLREKLEYLGNDLGVKTCFPSLEFCTDNGAMIAYAGFAKLNYNFDKFADKDLAINAEPRLSIETEF